MKLLCEVLCRRTDSITLLTKKKRTYIFFVAIISLSPLEFGSSTLFWLVHTDKRNNTLILFIQVESDCRPVEIATEQSAIQSE